MKSPAQLPAQPIRVYTYPPSGHSHRVRLFLSLLDLPNTQVHVDLAKGEHKTPAFLEINPFGQVPAIQDGDVRLGDSNAILVYLARRYDASGQWLPCDAQHEAEIQRWLSVAAGPLMFGPAHIRAGVIFGRNIEARAYDITNKLFGDMDALLATQQYLASTAVPTIADVAMYTYTAHVPEGGVSLESYNNILRWIADIEKLPGFVGMIRSSGPTSKA